MSKVSKFFFSPRLFFYDAWKNFNRRLLLKKSINKTLYFYRFNDWKKTFIKDFFVESHIEFFPFKMTASEFSNKYESKVLKNSNVEILVWGMNAPSYLIRFCRRNNIPLKYVEDGFIRSIGLGAEHTIPLSMAIDSQTLYFNAQKTSDLEEILLTYDFDSDFELLERARTMMKRLLETGISKYNQGQAIDIEEIYGEKNTKRVLVIGQVEDDASIKYGCTRSLTNNDLVRIAYIENPNAQIIYKPHPDVLHQKRKMQSNPKDVMHICNVLEEDISLSQSFETIDHVYTITSLAGFEALLRGIKVTTLGCPFYSGWGLTDDRQENVRRTRALTLEEVFAGAYLLYPIYFDPIYKVRVRPEEALERLISLKNDTLLNTPVQAEPVEIPAINKTLYFYRFNDWKKTFIKDFFVESHIEFFPFKMTASEFSNKYESKVLKNSNVEILVWGMNAPSYLIRFCRRNNIPLKYVEDGFIRSIGLGAEHTIPLSMAIDSQTLYFNAQKTSDLEEILLTYDFDSDFELLERARTMMKRLLETGISKYNQGQAIDIEEIYGEKNTKRVLVIGQVEDDASIKYGCTRSLTNNDLVRIAYIENPNAQIIYKPHPDVLHQKRKMQSNPKDVMHICNVLEEDISLSQSFETIDHVYTITSLAGFEALLRGIKVTTLGCPFYSGWGLTDDRQENVRRTRALTLEEVFAGAYLLYPIYFDPIYKVRVRPEEALERLISLKNDTLLNTPVQAEPVEIPAINKTLYFYRFNDWKKTFIKDFFVESHIEFFPFKMTASEFSNKYESKVLKNSNVEILVWGMNAPSYLIRFCRRNNIPLKYVEDGFIRSIGLGAEHTIPLSMAIDSQTLYFNAQKTSDLEEILLTYDFDSDFELLERARTMMKRLLETGISKYNQGQAIDIEEIYGEKNTKRVLVIGQVEDDASIKYGCTRSLTNNDLVRIAYIENPNAQIIYKPHPDVLHQKRKMQSNPKDVMHICNVLEEDISLSQSFETIDHVYTITSLAGFEALLRGIKVTTLGCPFYSGWGLTDDRQENVRRTRALTLEEVFAGAYLLYPIYFDPIYKVRVRPEEALERLISLKNDTLLNTPVQAESNIDVDTIDIKDHFILLNRNSMPKNYCYQYKFD
ncbi:hypothetical protein OXI21_08305 [Ignatzschineria sp. RMDPL8A]|uniref:capsular polysaccharide biosynthesis protein n=1 Tax=Ignatzschineria sp. RMDPL8A TaxID=2999236 RepID=UPI0024466647|nr:hypothetical protein [Ignatzschineria sp. RMDPL8A]MDG9730412.1 hypothetical protein [Ignatzschineria sp. RMDPL8A]